MKRNKILFVIAIVAMLAVLFVACDDGSQPEHTHTYGAWSITTAPTETTTGSASRVCACGETDTVTVAALSDTSVWSVEISQDATHTSNGFAVYKSQYGSVTTTSGMGQHTYGAWTMTKEPTMTETGTAIKVCDCGHSVTETVPVLSNNVWTMDDSNKPAHGVAGKVVYTSDYGTVEIAVAAQDHVYGKWTDNGNGTHTHSCSCGDHETDNCVYDQRVASAAYKKADATCTTGAEYYYSCVCGAKGTETFFNGEGTGHEFSEFTLTKAPTCTETGLATVKCGKCEYENDNSVISALGHTWDTEWHPYFGNSQYRDETTGEVIVEEDTESEYHAHACTVCGVFDVENKVAHTFGDEVLVSSPSNGYHQMSTVHTCECGYSEEVKDNLGYLEYWTKGEEVAPTYNNAGYAVYTSGSYTYTLVLDKLVAPYDNHTYYFVDVELRDGVTSGQTSVYSWSTAPITLDANGAGVGESNPVKGTNKVTMVDASTGKITWTVTDSENKTTTYNGYVDMNTGIVVMSNESPFIKDVYIGSWLEEGALNQSAFQGSAWGSNMAVTYTHNCSIGTHSFNIFINEDGEVSFGVDFVDANGDAISANAVYNASYVQIQKDGEKVDAFAKNTSGNLVQTDGMEGKYTAGPEESITLNGVGGATVSISGVTYNGTYSKVSGKDYYDVYFYQDEVAVVYSQMTFDVEAKTFTYTLPSTSIVYQTEYGTVDEKYNYANNNIAFTLPTPVVEGDTGSKVFAGWKLNGEGEYVTTYTPNGTSVTFVADWNTFTVVTVVDEVGGNSTVKVPSGTSILSQLPAYTSETVTNGYKFGGWYVDTDNDGVLNTDNDDVLDNFVEASDDVATMTVFADWSWAGNVTFEAQTGYTFVYDAVNGYWKSNNTGVNSSNALMEFTVTEGIAVVSFDYYCESEAASKWDYMTIYYGPSWISVTAGGNDCDWNWKTITTTLDASIDDSHQCVRITYQKDSSGFDGSDTAYIRNLTINGIPVYAQQPLNKDIAGTYTSDDTTVVVGAGGNVTIDDTAYIYTTVDTNKIGVTIDGTYKEIALDKANGTCTIAVPQVDVSYNLMGHGENSTTAVDKMSEQTLASAPTADGWKFRGWYTDEALTTEAASTFVASENVTFYAKWDKQVTITYKYNDSTTADATDSTYYANDKVTSVQAVDFNYGTKAFAGWFTQDGSTSGEWGDEFIADTIIEDNVTVYAKWVEPSAFAGTYVIVKLSASGVDNFYNGISTKLTVDNFGESTVTGYNGFSYGNTIKIEFVEGSTSNVNITVTTSYSTSTYNGAYDAESGVIVRADSTSGFGSTIYMMVPDNAEYKKTDFSAFAWSEGSVYHKLISFADRNASVDTTRTVFVQNATNVVFDALWEARDNKYAQIENVADIKANALTLYVTDGNTDYNYAKNASGNLVALTDTYQGQYGDMTATYIVVSGAGVISIVHDEDVTTGTYTVDSDGMLNVLTSDASYTVIVEDGEYVLEDNKVTITYVNDKVSVDSVNVYSGIKYTLVSEGLDVDGFVFRGWYDNADFSGSKVTSVTPTEAKTYYAKYDAAVSVTFDYNGYTDGDGNTSYAVTGKYANDTVGTLPTTLNDVTFGTKVFNGWYTANGSEGDWGTQVTTSTTLTANVTFYAKWIEPHAMMGEYLYGANLDPSETGIAKEEKTLSSGNYKFTVDALGNVTGWKTGVIKDYDPETGTFYIDVNGAKYYGGFNATTKTMYIEYSSNKTSAYHDIGFAAGAIDGATPTKAYDVAWNKGITKLVRIEYSNSTYNYILIMDRRVYAVTSWTAYDADGADLSDFTAVYNTATKITLVTDAGTMSFGKVNNNFETSDGMEGTYTTTETLGTVVVDGYGNATIGENSVSYTLNGNNITLVYNNRMYVLTLNKDNSTYTQAQDGYQGTYTMPDESAITLDGYGTVTGTTQTYVVSDATITIYDGENATSYGLDTANNKLLGKSKFAGLTFSGTYYDEWDESNNSIKFVFDDSSTLSGVLERGAYKVKFTATFDGTTLTMTMTENVSYASDWVGKTLTATLSGNTFTITSWYKTSGTYTFANQGTLTCADYQG